MNRIYLSKPGLVTCAGLNSDELWNSVTHGKQDGIKKVTAVSGDDFFAGRIDEDKIKPTTARYDMRIHCIQEMALNQIADEVAAAKEKYGAGRIAVCVGSCDNGTEFSVAGHKIFFETEKFAGDYSIEMQGADYPSTFVKEKFALEGPCLSFSTACSSSAEAIIKGAQLLSSGMADAVIAGGVDIASDTVLLGFGALEAVSSEITNPFSANRHGITLGEGAAFFVMTRVDDFKTGIGLLGYGESADAHHMTSPDPSGDGAMRAMEGALKSAGLKPSDIDYVNLHGTGTKLNDLMESKAVDAVFGEYKVAVSTTKPFTGHTLGAGSAVELALCFEAIRKNRGASNAVLPLQMWDGKKDEEIPSLNFVDKNNSGNCSKVKVCMSNSFAFGGSNCCLIVGEK
ncbi:beta-ketoacyl synthase N-terminal-like domain-containing protein [Treponema sp.]|uniref:beta-ketoacyl synthase N-terminal-like domain-containing protein n=1 Tax=Treponema sp. TaxID=166 RepID=UPI00298E930A|nr:beta-ketoacyl synthase N-terminal-like domain-containing protein [Treponema sp.]MCQ2241375.1 3-oxoacyl-ACP synthase [Treponema sp.]